MGLHLLVLRVLVLALLLCISPNRAAIKASAVHGASSNRRFSPRIPAAPSAWLYGAELMASARRHRLWERAALQRAVPTSNPQQLSKLIQKLHAGEPIVVVGFGDSLMADQGGCWHASYWEVQKLVPYPSSAVYPNRKCPEEGWVKGFMKQINMLFPHPGHMFINNGWPAISHQGYVSGHCIEQSLPSRADLVLVEGVSYLQSISTGRVGPGQPSDEAAMASGLEGLLLRLQGHYRSLPPVVLLTTHHLTGPDAASGRCLQAQLNSGSPAAECCKQFAHLLGANPSGPFLQHLRVEHIYSKLAAHYGLTALSLRDFYRHVFDAGQHTAAGLNECEFLRLMHRDAVHLRPLAEGGLGMLLWADLLISVLADAEELMARQAAAAAPDQRPGLHVGAGATAAAQAQAQLLAAAGGLPRKRLYRATGDAFRMRCYGGPRTEKAGFGAAAEANDANAANGIAAHGMAASRRGQLGPGHVPFQLKVLNNSGWNHVEYQIHGTSRKYKPGWVALRPGDRMTVQLDTLWDNATFTAPPTPPPPWQTAGLTVHHAKVAVNPYLLGVTFLRSYQHMGRVAIACTAGCSCAPQQLDGHHADPVSSEHYAEFPVSQHPACTLTFTILPGTSSGQHKFKLIQVVSKQRVADADG